MTSPQRPAGLTLIELMVALAIGSFLMIGAITVFLQSRATFRVTESVARLQETGRLVLDMIEPDIRMAHYWGLTNRAHRILGRASATDPAGPGPATCGNNWAIDLDNRIGTNNRYGWTACPGLSPVETGADTLTVRRASQNPTAAAALTARTLYIQSARGMNSVLFAGTVIPAGYEDSAGSSTHRLVVNGYYVSRASTLGSTVPSLRVKTLLTGGVIQDQEVLPGIEDFQVQYGVDTDAEREPFRGAIDRYVDADDPILDPGDAAFIDGAEILAVRIWLRVRAERPETGFTDSARYVYADQDSGPFNDGFRRIVVSKTIYLRNARKSS
jgi:type IV pilus assembly protein PilW